MSSRTPHSFPTFSSPDEERAHLKQRLAATFRLFGRFGFSEGVAGHVTARDPERPDCFWVNPFGLSFDLIRASDLILVNHDGDVVEGDWPVNRAAFAIHSQVHQARPDVHAAAHTHSRYGRAFSTLGRQLDPITQDSCAFYGDHALFDDFTGVVLDTEEGKRIGHALGDHKAVILRNHGLLTVGQTVDEAAWWFITMERTCEVQLLAEAAGAPVLIEPEYAELTASQVGSSRAGWFSFRRSTTRSWPTAPISSTDVPTAQNGEVGLYWEPFGDPADPTLLLVNGLGSQCISYADEWCRRFVDAGYRVIRMDNRDVGLSSKLPDLQYSLADMADDVVAVLDAAGVERAHVLGVSMGGMIVQRLAIDHPERLLTMTSVMSRTGEPGFGESSPEALAALMRPPAASREEHVERHVEALGIYGSKPEWRDEGEARARAAAAYDRCFEPAGIGRQMVAVGRDGSRDERLRQVEVPTLVLHGSRDTLIRPDGGRHTADVIPGAVYVEIDGMGHDYPRAVWDEWVSTWTSFVERSQTRA